MPSCKSWQYPVLQREDWDEDKSSVKGTETEEEDNHYDFTDAKKELRWGLVYSILTSHNDNHQYNDYHGSLFCWCWERRRR